MEKFSDISHLSCSYLFFDLLSLPTLFLYHSPPEKGDQRQDISHFSLRYYREKATEVYLFGLFPSIFTFDGKFYILSSPRSSLCLTSPVEVCFLWSLTMSTRLWPPLPALWSLTLWEVSERWNMSMYGFTMACLSTSLGHIPTLVDFITLSYYHTISNSVLRSPVQSNPRASLSHPL